MSSSLSQRYYSSFFFSGSLTNLHCSSCCFNDLPSTRLILLPILNLYSLALLIEMMVQQQWSRKLFLFLSLQLLGNLLVLLHLYLYFIAIFCGFILLLSPSYNIVLLLCNLLLNQRSVRRFAFLLGVIMVSKEINDAISRAQTIQSLAQGQRLVWVVHRCWVLSGYSRYYAVSLHAFECWNCTTSI